MPSKIEWLGKNGETWNPIVGCTKVGAGCANCYAARLATMRAANPRTPQYHGIAEHGEWTGEVRFLPEKLDVPLHWRNPRSIFVCSMADLFHPDVPDEWRHRIFDVMWATPQHRYIVLTKRIERAARYLADVLVTSEYDHLWLGPSVWDQDSWDAAAPHVAALKNAGWQTVVSAEPLLGPIDIMATYVGATMHDPLGPNPFSYIDALVVGGETGPGARPMHPDWARSLRD